MKRFDVHQLPMPPAGGLLFFTPGLLPLGPAQRPTRGDEGSTMLVGVLLSAGNVMGVAADFLPATLILVVGGMLIERFGLAERPAVVPSIQAGDKAPPC